MAEIQLIAGMASKYFVTDFDNALATMERPYLLVSQEMLNLEKFSEALIAIQSRNPNVGRGAKSMDIAQAMTYLTDLIQQRTTQRLIDISNPLLVISNGIQKETLASMKILQVRQLCPILAIDVSALKFDEVKARLEQDFKSEQIYKNEAIEVSMTAPQCYVVAGIYKAIISTERRVKEIIRAHPEIVTSGAMQNTDEPIL
jgi:hypothetical protein